MVYFTLDFDGQKKWRSHAPQSEKWRGQWPLHILALRVGKSPAQYGPGYTTGDQ